MTTPYIITLLENPTALKESLRYEIGTYEEDFLLAHVVYADLTADDKTYLENTYGTRILITLDSEGYLM